MKKENFDDRLKEELGEYDSKFDINKVWSAIESDVDAINENEDEKRRPLIWIFGVLFCTVIIGGTIYFMTSTSVEDNTVTEKQEKDITNKTENLKILSEEKNTELATKDHFPNEEELVKVKNNSNDKTGEQINQDAKLFNKTSANILIKKAITNKKINDSKNNQSIDDKAIFPGSFSVGLNSIISNKDANNVALKNIDKIKKDGLDALTKTVQTNQVKSFSIFKNIETLFVNFLFDEKAETSVPSSLADYYKDIQRKKRRRSSRGNDLKFSIGVQGGVSLANKKMEAKNSDANPYLNLREQTEISLETIHLGLTGNLLLPSGLEFTTGFQLTQINEKFEFQEMRTEFDTMPNGVLGYIINPNRDTIEVIGDVVSSRDIEFKKKAYNKYRLYDIPLLVGYHINNEPWSIGAQAGIIANLKLKTTGFVFDENESEIDLAENQASPILRSSVGLSFYIGGVGSYALTDNIQLSISPFFRFFPKSFTTEENQLKQNYSLIGANIGMKYQF